MKEEEKSRECSENLHKIQNVGLKENLCKSIRKKVPRIFHKNPWMGRHEKEKRILAGILAIAILVSSGHFPFSMRTEAGSDHLGNTDTYWSSTWHYYCIDHSGIAANGYGADGDLYQAFAPSAGLSSAETALLFWAALSMEASFGNMPTINKVYQQINEKAAANGLRMLVPAVTQSDLGTLLHLSSTRKKYAWLDFAVAHGEEYLALAGLMSGGGSGNTGGSGGSGDGSSGSGKPGSGSIGAGPAVLEGHTSRGNAYAIDPETLTISFDPGGKDRDFIRTVPLKFWNGSEYTSAIPTGWSYEKTDTSIQFHTSDPASSLQVMFDTVGTIYGAGAGGGYQSAEELYEDTLELWQCIQCSGTHKHVAGGNVPLESHQRCIFLDIQEKMDMGQASFYAAVGGGKSGTAEGSLDFKIYRHEEDWETNYNVQLYKYDYETGKPLEGSIFRLYERFDDQDQIQDEDGYGVICRDGDPYLSYHRDDTVTWDGFRFVSSLHTGDDGRIHQTINHGYHYEKTFCDGHPEPTLAEVPEEETDENGEVSNQDEIDAAEEENERLQEDWQACVDACEDYADQYPGVHFHWVNDGADASASGEEAFVQSGCQVDAEETYEAFISLRYSYAFQEEQAREGYVLHGKHQDDVPIEIIRTDSSEHGANAQFTGEYSGQITASLSSRIAKTEQAAVVKMEKQYYPVEEASTFQYQPQVIKWPEKVLEILCDNAKKEKLATPSSAEKATPSEAKIVEAASTKMGKATASEADRATPNEVKRATQDVGCDTPSNAEAIEDGEEEAHDPVQSNRLRSHLNTITVQSEDDLEDIGESGTGGADLFEKAYEEALASESVGDSQPQGPPDQYSHCNNQDGEGDAFRVYDHRTEGEIHINKRDMMLEQGETDHPGFDSYGEVQADAVLEGAVYGLFAAEEIRHPDGKTGIVYEKGNLVAVAATDKYGDASFLVNTEAPGHVYDYEAGKIRKNENGFADRSPKNLYTKNETVDDYTGDRGQVRSYIDLESENGNCWIGRPLFLGDYFIKELTRSEGYELSVSNKNQRITNAGQTFGQEEQEKQGEGYGLVTRNLFYEVRPSENPTGSYDDPDYNELFFMVQSKKTGAAGFDVLLGNLPSGTKAYRAEAGEKTIEVQVPYGDYQERPVVDADGNPVFVTVEPGEEGKYIRYQADGSIEVQEKPSNLRIRDFKMVSGKEIDREQTEVVIKSAISSMDEDQVADMLEKPFTTGSEVFFKAKLEAALRANGYRTPSENGQYSTVERGIYDRGKRGAEITYGSPVQTVQIPKFVDGIRVIVEEALWAVLDDYEENPWLSYGGIEQVRESKDHYEITLYRAVIGNPENYGVMEPGGNISVYHRLEYLPDDLTEDPRYVYAHYSKNDGESFGTFSEMTVRISESGTRYYSMLLMPDSQVDGSGQIIPKMVRETCFYQVGEVPLDAKGQRIQRTQWRQDTKTVTMTREEKVWRELPVQIIGGKQYVHVAGAYTDQFGNRLTDETEPLEQELRLVVPERLITLTSADLAQQNSGWKTGDVIGSGAYYRDFKGVYVKAYRQAEDGAEQTGSYVKFQKLCYPGQDSPWQDGEGRPGSGENTRKNPVGLQERIIQQKVQIVKTIQNRENAKEYGDQTPGEGKLPGFRFKIYLKSNLESLYRDEAGEVCWVDKKGNAISILEEKEKYPGLVPRIHTRALHRQQPIQKNSYDAVIANESLYSYGPDGMIQKAQNLGYTSLLERNGNTPNYEKFFAAIRVANQDLWDDHAPTYTSERPIGNQVNRIAETLENAKVSDRVRQFAIDWYLDDEVKKLTREKKETGEMEGKETEAYSDELLDRALWEAIQKAQNYLKPFFTYDLDDIYAVAWEPDPKGGNDQDPTTLSCDESYGNEAGGYYAGVSVYLPYGIYVAAEQQPKYDELLDFANKHYEIDKPKEIIVPSVYKDDEVDIKNNKAGDYDSFYQYDSGMKMALMESRYRIRFGEEQKVVQAHSHSGDFQVYPYGLATSKIQDGNYFMLTQSEYRPYKNYYNEDDVWKNTENPDLPGYANPYYISENQSGKKKISGIYRYSSESEAAGTLPDGTRTMQGSLRAEDGIYAPMLVPHTVTEPVRGQKEAALSGYAVGVFRNQFYTTGLRIEKLDSQTHENLLHDDAIFRIYRGKRQEAADGQGAALFYEEETMITGSQEFLTAMGAENIRPVKRQRSLWERLWGKTVEEDELFSGVVAAGTPICEEKDQIVLRDQSAYATVRNGQMQKEYSDGAEDHMKTGQQTVGYAELPDVLGAGVYVIAEMKAPAGYVRCRPIVVEIYSDKVTYYQEGDRERRIYGAVYGSNVRIYVENAPIQLEVKKWSDSEEHPYVKGAEMALYDAIEITPTGDAEDYSYEGVTILRNGMGNVTRMYVKQGYAGSKIVYGLRPDGEKETWDAEEVERPDTDILYYDLAGLRLTEYLWDDESPEHSLYAIRDGKRYLELNGGDLTKAKYSSVNQMFQVAKGTHIYHLDQDGLRDSLVDPVTGMAYLVKDFDGTNGSYDQLAGLSGTGKGKKQILVWPVKVAKDAYGHVIARDKIRTERPATVGEYQSGSAEEESGYLTGSWRSAYGENSHQEQTLRQNPKGQNLNGEELKDKNNGSFPKQVNPILNAHGLPIYYQKSQEQYEKMTELYDRDGEMVRQKVSDHLPSFNQNTYQKKEEKDLYEESSLWHRQGEGYVLENVWITSEKRPNDPFDYQMTDGQADRLKRVPVGCYILEERKVPDGFVKGFPVAVWVGETRNLQKTEMEDETIKVQIEKLDAPPGLTRNVLEMTKKNAAGKPEKIAKESILTSEYSCDYVEQALLVLYRLEKQGLETKKKEVARWTTGKVPKLLAPLTAGTYRLEELNTPDGFVTAEPVEIEVKMQESIQPVTMEDDHTRIQIRKYEKVGGKEVPLNGAVFSLYMEDGERSGIVRQSEADHGLAADHGSEAGHRNQTHRQSPVYTFTTDDGKRFREFIPEFEEMYQTYGAKKGASVGWEYQQTSYRAVCVDVERLSEEQTETDFPAQVILKFQMDEGEIIRIKVHQISPDDRKTCQFEYQFDYQKLPKINAYAAAWLTVEGMRRIEYLPVGVKYRLVEEQPPKGYQKSEDIWITVEETGDVQQYSIENKPGKLWIDKREGTEKKQQPGAVLVL